MLVHQNAPWPPWSFLKRAWPALLARPTSQQPNLSLSKQLSSPAVSSCCSTGYLEPGTTPGWCPAMVELGLDHSGLPERLHPKSFHADFGHNTNVWATLEQQVRAWVVENCFDGRLNLSFSLPPPPPHVSLLTINVMPSTHLPAACHYHLICCGAAAGSPAAWSTCWHLSIGQPDQQQLVPATQ
jgi:hypothetical protein